MNKVGFVVAPHAGNLNIFINSVQISKHSGKLITSLPNGVYRVRVEQKKIVQSKRFFRAAMAKLFDRFYTAGLEIDGESPLYAVLEADMLVDRDIVIKIGLCDSKGGARVEIGAPAETGFKMIRSEFTATKKERRKWFMLHALLCSAFFFFGLPVFIGAGFSSLSGATGIAGALFSWLFSAFAIFAWAFVVLKIYRRSISRAVSFQH
jgi:hypothetical protein